MVEASVEASLLFDCQARVWTQRELKRLQGFMDRCYRHVWCRRTRPPLIQMQEEGKRMEDVRRELGVKSVRWKVEKRVLERVGHVMRMSDDRVVKAMVLGWWSQLEGERKMLGWKRKTILYWKKLVREAGADWTRIGQLTSDRKKWKGLVRERMKRIKGWEDSRGHKWTGVRVEVRNSTRKECVPDANVCEVCGKVCVSRGGLTIHRKRMHEVSEKKRRFGCERCGREFLQEANLKNHLKACDGEEEEAEKTCTLCGKTFKKRGFKNHTSACAARRGVALVPSPPPQVPVARVYRARRKNCPICDKEMSATNISRHCAQVHGGGANP